MSEETLDNSKAAAHRILQAFDAFAKAHGLTLWIDYGTLLGAARHKGVLLPGMTISTSSCPSRNTLEAYRDFQGKPHCPCPAP